MQEINQSSVIFSERSDALATALKMSLRDLADQIGISQAMLFAYRTGKNPISRKAWKKLEAAEIKAGLRENSQAEVRAGKQLIDELGGEERGMVTGPHLAFGHYLSMESLLDDALKTRQPFPAAADEDDFQRHLRMFNEHRIRGRAAMVRMRDIAEGVGHLVLKNAAVNVQAHTELDKLEKEAAEIIRIRQGGVASVRKAQ